MGTIYWHMNATREGAKLSHGIKLHPDAQCTHEHG